MKITKEQQATLDELVCERLRDNPDSEKLIQSFQNEKGSLIVNYLKQRGLDEDSEGSTAFYIVRTKNNDVLMFFSLKCGELFDPLFDEHEVAEGYEKYLLILQALKNADADPEAQERAIGKLQELSNKKGTPLHIVLNVNDILKETKHKAKLLQCLSADKETEQNEKISRVNRTYPGVELVHFCTNENCREVWKKLGFSRSMGEVIFWNKIVPKFFDVQEIVGCEYAFLFAADLSEDRILINYYNVSLKFEIDDAVGTNKPYYDFACAFMCQKLSSLKENQELYFKNFNLDENEDIV